jgi:type I restriction enzyme S subunit
MVLEGWKIKTIEELCHTIYRYPNFYGMEKFQNGIPVVRGEHLKENGTISNDWSDYWFVSPSYAGQFPRTKLEKSDIVMSVRGTVGRFSLVGDEFVDAQISPNLIRMAPDSSLVVPEFLFYALKPAITSLLSTSTVATTIASLRASDLKKVHILIPNRPEQKKIAAILSSVDDAIQATQAVIYQTHRVKQGLMQHLLTRGIGHTRFKQTEIEEIPEEWELIPFNQVLDVRSGKGFRLGEYVNEGIKLLRIDNVSWGEITWDSIAYLPTHYADEYSELLLKEGDILLALNRPITQGKLKLAILKREDSPAILYQRVGKILFKNDNMLNNFVFHLLNYSLPPFIMEQSVGSDQPFINITALRKLKLPIPTLNEQHKIAAILDENDECIETHNKYLEHLFNLKHGLMQDLLTGRVRVKLNGDTAT